jgi:hypothetical protein
MPGPLHRIALESFFDFLMANGSGHDVIDDSMKIFLSTLSAILVAAIIIWFVVSAHNARVASAIQREELRKITLEGELQHANAEWNEQMRRDPQFDPNGEKVRSRLREIREASENGKPIPPNPWQSSGQQKQTANETERPQPNQNPPPQ